MHMSKFLKENSAATNFKAGQKDKARLDRGLNEEREAEEKMKQNHFSGPVVPPSEAEVTGPSESKEHQE